jgi:isoleucyl-tRNA synthetase
MTSFYPQTNPNQNIAEIEKKVLAYWDKEKIFAQSIQQHSQINTSKRENNFVFYDGPPFANGLPHYGHLLTGFIKDLYARFYTSLGKKVERRFGWDCHGLPAEMEAEKELGVSGPIAIKEYGIDNFNKHCQSSVLKYANQWQYYVMRQGRWVDFDNSYKTMDINFMESVIWAFKELYKKGLIYHDMKVVPYSVACQTPLSHFETRLDNSYRLREDKTIVVCFSLLEKLDFLPENKPCKLLAWTTTPWTLPANLALAINPKLTYVVIDKEDAYYIIAESRLGEYKDKLQADNAICTLEGQALVGLKYKPLFNYFENHKGAFYVKAASFVTNEGGTGIVHIAPAFGEDDYKLCKEEGIEPVFTITTSGHFKDAVQELEGMHIFESTDLIIKILKKQEAVFKVQMYTHSYPHCWRTDTPLIYMAIPSWYVKASSLREKMSELNKSINWIPSNIKDGLFGQWILNANDWAISRYRFWGTPIPVWISDDPKYPRIDIYGSISEIEKDFNVKVTDLHRPFIDSLTRINPDDPSGKSVMKRVEEVFDCWFESGSMPYAKEHYPFENKEKFESNFPADFIVEYKAQTRGWFYTLMVLAAGLFEKPPFLNCICHGVVLDTKGQKLSKRLNNYPDPKEVLENYGAEALRFTMLASPVSTTAADLLLDKDGKLIYDSLRLNIKSIWQTYHFFCMYANADKIQGQINYNYTNLFDKYIISELMLHVNDIKESLLSFNTQLAFYKLNSFFEILNNWYIRRNKPRFWQTEINNDKQDAYNVLFSCLITISKAASSMLPMLMEEIFCGLNQGNAKTSVHLELFPSIEKSKIDTTLINAMNNIKAICNAGLCIRSKSNIKVRQPISKIRIITYEANSIEQFSDIIKDELNVKEIEISNDVDKYCKYELMLNIEQLAKRIPQEIQSLGIAVKQNNWTQNGSAIKVGNISLKEGEYRLNLTTPFNNAYAIQELKCIVMLDLALTKELIDEGNIKDLIRHIQESRKQANLNISQKILLSIETENQSFLSTIKNYQFNIEKHTLSTIVYNEKSESFFYKEVDINKQKLKIKFYS